MMRAALIAFTALTALTAACPTPAGDECNSDVDCKKLELCRNGICVDETGGEGEGTAGEGEGEGASGEGEGEGASSEGEGEGVAGEGEGEGDTALLVVVRDGIGGGEAVVPLGFTFASASAQAGSQAARCSLAQPGGGSSLHFRCDEGALGDVALDVALTGAPTGGLQVIVRAVPGDWLDTGRARRTLITFDNARLPPATLQPDADVIHVPAAVAPPGALSLSSLPELLDDGGVLLPLDLDDDGGFTNVASTVDHVWLYDVPAAGAQGGLVSPNSGDYTAIFHFGTSIVGPLVDAVDSSATLAGTSTPAPGAAGAGVALSGAAPLSTTAPEDLVTESAGTLSAWLSSSATPPLASSAIVLGAADGDSLEEHDGTNADETAIFVDVDGAACGFSGAESSGPLCSSSPVLDGAWHQLMFTWGPSGESLYVDGAFAGAATRSPPVAFTAHALTIGGALDGTRSFAGLVDEARIATTVFDEHLVALAFQSIANPIASQRRFTEGFHLAGVVTFSVDADNPSADITLTPAAPPPAELVDGEPITLVAMAAMSSTTLARMTSALGVTFAGADFDQASANVAVNVVTSSASGILDLTAPIVLHDVARGDVTPSASPVVVALAIFAGAPSSPTRNLGSTNSAGPLATDATLGAEQIFAVASTGTPSLSDGGDALASLRTTDGVGLDVIGVAADALVTQATVSVSEGAWGGYALGP